jgi:membrane fusion protein (multidrug efflux system)
MNSLVAEAPATVDAPPRGRRWPAKRLALSVAGLLVVFAAARYADDWWRVGSFIETTDDAYVGGDVTVIAPEVSGFIAAVAVTDNQAVKAGDLLIRLDDRDFRAALAKAEAAVAGRQASLDNLDATRRLQLAVIDEAEAGIAAADAETQRARDERTRFETLSARAAASIETFQRTDADYKKAVAAGAEARARLDAAKRQLDVIATEKQQAEAALDGAVAERETARLNLGYTELRAPIDGTVGNRTARQGAFATGGVPLVSIVPAHGLWVDANFKESQLGRLNPGAAASIEADVLPGIVFHGQVASLAPATGAEFSVLPPENATGNFTKIVQRVPVRILLEGDASALGRLRPGLSVTASVDERETAP